VKGQSVPTGASASRSDAPRPGLVPIENNPQAAGLGPVPFRDAVEAHRIDQQRSRLRRLKGRVEHSVRLAGASLARLGGNRWRCLFLTLTYADADGWKPEDVTEYFHLARDWARRRGFRLRYSWVAEVQRRGAVHYHATVWIPRRERLPYADVSGWWPHGSSNVKPVKGGLSGVVAYLGKYLSKGFEVDAPKLPKGARIFGSAGHCIEERRELRYRLAPFWVRDALGTWADIRKVKGGWADRLSGEFLRSLWRVWFGGPGCVWAYKLAG
jgi:hypothetical protein